MTETHICKLNIIDQQEITEDISNIPTELIANFFKAFSDINRVKIGYLLLKHDNLCVHDIANVVNLSIANTSHHLRLMKNLGITSSKKQGTSILYSLKDEHIKKILTISFEHLLEDK
ncbi:hypothetical protein BHF71_08210 [Vulcanibacillus modesticaldus]|uniref:HTH arsR-type domain-containing protein n=1 Tax=Vulcanibacillus modesticaldus TaxID=337097 RepID=A0A1D2YVF5_9BACI|nr:metalloregulator ArsR/SmtB family transcription factor [Vulcanibacillus modesticaldus]OEF99596.1 hypothetical protein BHF71_08210 [Vulcanibacillus modesticaldus]